MGKQRFQLCVCVCVCVCVCMPVFMCVYLNLLGCGNREDNGSSSTASNNDQIGAQVSLPELTWLGFMILVWCECVNLWSSCSDNHSPDKQLFHMDKGPCLGFRGHNWKSWKFAFKATFLTRGCLLKEDVIFLLPDHIAFYVNSVE